MRPAGDRRGSGAGRLATGVLWLIGLSAGVAASCSEQPAEVGKPGQVAKPAQVEESGQVEEPAQVEEPGQVEKLVVRVLAEYPHDRESFTQGLLWHDGWLYESTGQYGASRLLQVEPSSGKAFRSVALPPELFGEGLARVGDSLIQITWREQVARVYDLNTFEQLDTHTYSGQGWGLCFDGEKLIMSDGSNGLSFRDPANFEETGKIWVTLEGRTVAGLNELECVDGAIYANVYGAEQLVRIDPSSGRITAVIGAPDLLPLMLRQGTDVFNGVAYHPEKKSFFLTGKYWPKLFEVEFVAVAE